MAKNKNIKNRKVVRLTFIRPKNTDPNEEKKILEKMIDITEIIGVDKANEIIIDEKTSEKIRNSGLPELWLHDFENKEQPLQPFLTYYVVDFDDGSRKVVVILAESRVTIPAELISNHEPQMYQ
jgi:small-conductance mechanosensitive channel